jgi:uncharacterized protein
MMKKVWFMPLPAGSDASKTSVTGRKLLEIITEAESVDLDPKVALKVHFGEKGNVTYLGQPYFDGVIDLLMERGCSPSYIETNVLYRGERMTREPHLRLAREHGFDRLPIVIADGEHGEDYSEVAIDGKHFTRCKIAKGIVNAPQMIVLSHFKGHYFSGHGGAIKQLAMGCAARGGKLDQHAGNTPFINPLKCKRCRLCAKKCPAGAIRIGFWPRINRQACIGCAACIALCPAGAISANMLNSLSGAFFERLAEYALAAARGKPHIYLSYALNITRGCDCMGSKMKPIAPDLGVFASMDPVAIDAACLDLLEKTVGRPMFGRGRRTLTYSEKIGLGSTKYELVEIR